MEESGREKAVPGVDGRGLENAVQGTEERAQGNVVPERKESGQGNVAPAAKEHGRGGVALVTGTSSGFGMLTAVRLARLGWTVYAGMRNPERGGELMARARAAGAAERIRPVRLDVTREDEIRAAVETILAESGRIDALVNNAGFAAGGFFEFVPLARWREQFETNVFGLVAVTQAVLPAMRKQGGGRIVLVGSVSGRIGFPGLSPYAASKHAVEGLAESLRLELKPFGIFVSIVEPASYRTPIWEKGLRDAMLPPADSPYAPMYRKLQPLFRRSAEGGGDPERVAAAIVRALTDRRPKLRYAPGVRERAALAMKNLAPWSWIEWSILRVLAGAGKADGKQRPASGEGQHPAATGEGNHLSASGGESRPPAAGEEKHQPSPGGLP